jgi:hypothetical protein
MTNRYSVEFQGRKLAVAFASPHPEFEKHIVVTVVPLTRKGKWEQNNLEIKFEAPLHDIFPESKPEVEAITEVIAQAAIEPWKVKLISVKQWV